MPHGEKRSGFFITTLDWGTKAVWFIYGDSRFEDTGKVFESCGLLYTGGVLHNRSVVVEPTSIYPSSCMHERGDFRSRCWSKIQDLRREAVQLELSL